MHFQIEMKWINLIYWLGAAYKYACNWKNSSTASVYIHVQKLKPGKIISIKKTPLINVEKSATVFIYIFFCKNIIKKYV